MNVNTIVTQNLVKIWDDKIDWVPHRFVCADFAVSSIDALSSGNAEDRACVLPRTHLFFLFLEGGF